MYDKNLGIDYSAGASGSDVAKIQTALQLAGFSPGPIDGVYGSKTRTAVQSFQSAHGLVIDGIVGSLTWRKLLSGAAPTGNQPATLTIPKVSQPGSSSGTASPPFLSSVFGGLGSMSSIISLGLGLLIFFNLKKKRRRR